MSKVKIRAPGSQQVIGTVLPSSLQMKPRSFENLTVGVQLLL